MREVGAGRSVWASVVDSVAAPIALVDRTGRIVDANRAFRIDLALHGAERAGDVASLGPEVPPAVRTAAVVSGGLRRCRAEWGEAFDCVRLPRQPNLLALISRGRD